jgi:hypothetical protein
METMTPKEKALRLMGRFEDALTLQDCAKITVDEILKINSVDKDIELSDYWIEVKEEIKKL